jgi:hypothetical protein
MHAKAVSAEHTDIIATTLKRQWFAEIVDLKKKIEYREMKPY